MGPKAKAKIKGTTVVLTASADPTVAASTVNPAAGVASATTPANGTGH